MRYPAALVLVDMVPHGVAVRYAWFCAALSWRVRMLLSSAVLFSGFFYCLCRLALLPVVVCWFFLFGALWCCSPLCCLVWSCALLCGAGYLVLSCCVLPPSRLLPLLLCRSLPPVVLCPVLLCVWCCLVMCWCACVLLFRAMLVCATSGVLRCGALLRAVLSLVVFCGAVGPCAV